MTDEVKKAETGPKSPGWISNRIAEAIRGLRGAPRNPWTHMLEQQLQNALGTARAIHYAAVKASGASAEANSPTPTTSPAEPAAPEAGSSDPAP